ncbi:phosphoribosylformylglycinamidine synthase, purS protein [Helicobacter sp. 12S02232-10]|uniref:phosphoribosylformylglycinamidine synthase subunit PurS n=1 Tax=Helicobacter sp. 12S02232-10 TaxID=1476197 RepID=UPI000BA50345|nr:phosphoribosylformylglycinamidine synthase subunit PurS [Helicobacter sp. 12S02232-10]PAF49953.1 phosphoribosylformylglycinamidine synthase, purS protein [Helicobacter sp. 12S02232-10]
MVIEVNVSLKDGVLDPQAKAIAQALKALGFSDIKNLRLSKKISLEFDHQDKQKAFQEAEKMAQELLANSVIENYSIHCEEK